MNKIGIILIVALSIWFGMWVGVRDYKSKCELVSNRLNVNDKFYECDQ